MGSRRALFKRLKAIPLFKDLAAAHLRDVARAAEIRELGRRELVFSKAESAQNMFVVLSGRVKIFTRSEARLRKTFAYLGPGDFFGEMGLLEGEPRSASAEAVAPSRLLVIGKRRFKELLAGTPELAYSLLLSVSARLRRSNQEIESLLFRNVLGRVSRALCDLARREGRGADSPVLLRERYTHQELADLVGTSREPLSRALSKLRRLGLVDARDGRFRIQSPRKLAELAGD